MIWRVPRALESPTEIALDCDHWNLVDPRRDGGFETWRSDVASRQLESGRCKGEIIERSIKLFPKHFYLCLELEIRLSPLGPMVRDPDGGNNRRPVGILAKERRQSRSLLIRRRPAGSGESSKSGEELV